MPTPSSDETVAALTAWLTTPRNVYGIPGPISPLQEHIRKEIDDLARAMAHDVVSGTPALAEHVRQLAQDTVRRAMLDDAQLRQMVISAVSTTLVRHALAEDGD